MGYVEMTAKDNMRSDLSTSSMSNLYVNFGGNVMIIVGKPNIQVNRKLVEEEALLLNIPENLIEDLSDEQLERLVNITKCNNLYNEVK